jgi:hypothetical protein
MSVEFFDRSINMTKAFWEKLKAVIEQNLDEEDGIKLGAAQSLVVEPEENISSGDVTQAIIFDGDGKASFGFSQYCPVNISPSAYIDGLDGGVRCGAAIQLSAA